MKAVKGKAGETKEFDKVLRGMLTAKPLSVAEISARIRARRKARQKDKQAGRTTRLRG
jgi:hypothetical protein